MKTEDEVFLIKKNEWMKCISQILHLLCICRSMGRPNFCSATTSSTDTEMPERTSKSNWNDANMTLGEGNSCLKISDSGIKDPVLSMHLGNNIMAYAEKDGWSFSRK